MSPSPEPEVGSEGASGRLPVLICATDDDAGFACGVLHDAGHACIRCESEDDVLARIDEHAGALLAAEAGLSDRFVERLAAALRSQPPWSDLPVLLIASDEQHRLRMPDLAVLGNIAVLTPPVAVDALASAIASALRARRRQFEMRDLLRSQHEQARRKDEFLAMLAHELRNPLAPVRFAAQVLLTSDLSREQLRSTAELIGRQVAHMARIVDDLLDVSRMTRGLVLLSRTPLDFAGLARATVHDHGAVASARNVRLRTRIPARPVPVVGDEMRLRQVLDNLLDNAIKFSMAGSDVEIEMDVRDGEAVLSVVDHGEGLDPDLVPHLFEPFSQGDRSLDRRQGGLGLGLALVRGLTRLHGGEATAASEGPGRGSTFTIRLPHAGVHRADRGGDPDATDTTPTPLRVLIAEDNRDAAESLRMLLEFSGHEVEVVHTGPSAVQRARDLHPDVVLCDIGLPGMSGYDVARRLRRDPGTAGARLVAITGYGTDDDRLQALAAGFDCHLRKPVEPSVLLAQLSDLPGAVLPAAIRASPPEMRASTRKAPRPGA